jgi:site-specific DNA-cytosine methylase
MGGNRARAPRKDIHRGMPATTTPLVSWVFDDFFMKGVAGVKRVGDDSWMQYLTGFDGLEVQCRGPEKEVNGVLRFPEGQQVPVVELADGHNAVSLAKFEKLAGCAAKKPRESIKFTASGLALSATAKEAGWKGTDSDLSASGAAAMDVEDDEEGADENHDKPKKSRTSADAARLARPSSTGSSKRILMEAGADEEVVCAQWEGEGELANGRTFYRSTKLGGQRLEIGDFCLALDEDGEECLFRVASMWEELLQKGSPSRRASASASRKGKAGAAAASKRTSTFLGHKYMFGADTVLGSAADGREVFMLDELMELPLSSITCKGMCAMLSTPSGWHELGGQPIEQCMQDIDALFADQEEAGKSEFFVRKVYEPEQGRFVDIPSSSALLPPHAFDRGSDFDALAFVESATCSLWQKEIPLCSVSICVEDLMQDAGLGLAEGHNLLTRAMELLGDLRATRVLGLPTALTLGKRKVQSYAQAQADGQHFALGDCVYLPSEAFDFRCSPPDEDPVWLKELEERRQDSGTYPELYRLKEGRRFKGSHDGTHPFRIGQVLRIYTVSGDVRLSVRKFYRPSDTREGEEFSSREHTHRLYWSHETATVDLDDVLGICRVVRLSNLHPGEDPWSIGDGLTKYKDTFFFTNCYDTQDRGSPAFTALPDADAPRSASGRNQGGRAGDETESDFDPDSGDECANESAFLSSFPTCFETLEAAAPAWVSKGKGKNSGATGACAPADSEHAHAPQPMACLDIFAGCGGLTEGLHAAGAVESKWAIEFEERAAEAFKLNFPGAETFTDDCNIILKQVMDGMEADNTGRRLPQKGEVQAMCGGPPCQGYSGMNRFNEGQYSRFKNSLVSTYLSYCDYYRPRFFLLENVKNFGHFKEGGVLKLCIRTLITMGYQVAFGCLQAANYGVPQSRRRMFIVACAPGEVLPKFPEPTHTFTRTGCQLTVTINDTPYCPLRRQGGPAPLKRTTVRDAIGDLPVVNLGESRTEMLYDGQSASDYQKLMRSSMPANKDGVVFDHVVKEMGAIHLARFQHIPTWAGADWRLLPNVQVTLRDGRRTSLLEYPEPSGKVSFCLNRLYNVPTP